MNEEWTSAVELFAFSQSEGFFDRKSEENDEFRRGLIARREEPHLHTRTLARITITLDGSRDAVILECLGLKMLDITATIL